MKEAIDVLASLTLLETKKFAKALNALQVVAPEEQRDLVSLLNMVEYLETASQPVMVELLEKTLDAAVGKAQFLMLNFH